MKKRILIIAFIAIGVSMLGTELKAQAIAPTYYITLYKNNFGDLSNPMGGFWNGPADNNTIGGNPKLHLDLNSLVDLKGIHHSPNEDMNDHARSATITTNGRVVFTLYDNPSGQTDDDYVIITVKRAVTNLLIGTFEYPGGKSGVVDNADYNLNYHHENGLDGKVSSLKITQ